MTSTAMAGPEDASDAVAAVVDRHSSADIRPRDVDDITESAFRAEAQARGEHIPLEPAGAAPIGERDVRNLPPLDDLVQRVPKEVRDILEELFRAKFLQVRRVPKDALKP